MRPCSILVNFIKDMWSRKVLILVNELNVAELKKGVQTHN